MKSIFFLFIISTIQFINAENNILPYLSPPKDRARLLSEMASIYADAIIEGTPEQQEYLANRYLTHLKSVYFPGDVSEKDFYPLLKDFMTWVWVADEIKNNFQQLLFFFPYADEKYKLKSLFLQLQAASTNKLWAAIDLEIMQNQSYFESWIQTSQYFFLFKTKSLCPSSSMENALKNNDIIRLNKEIRYCYEEKIDYYSREEKRLIVAIQREWPEVKTAIDLIIKKRIEEYEKLQKQPKLPPQPSMSAWPPK